MPADAPLVSIVVPVYNHESYLGDCLHSVYQQTYPNLELVVIDDGSSDRSGEIAETHLADCPFPYQFIKQENQGAHAAINKGIRESHGDYISILNSDDRYHPERILRMIEAAFRTSRRFLFSKVRLIDDGGKPLPRSAPLHYYYNCSLKAADFFPLISYELLRHNTAITTGNFFFHRSLADEIGPFNNLITCHDWDYLLRAILVETPLFIKQELMDYRVHEDSTIQKYPVLRKKEIDQVVSHYLMRMDSAQNPLAPGPKVCGVYWSIFVDVYLKHFNGYPRAWKLLQESKRPSLWDKNAAAAWAIRACFAATEKGFNQFVWQEREIRKGNPRPGLKVHKIYIRLLRWILGRLAWIMVRLT